MRLNPLPDPDLGLSLQRLFIALGGEREPGGRSPAALVRLPADEAGRRTLERVLQEYVLAFLLRNGGGLRHAFFPQVDRCVTGYLWEEPVRSQLQLTLSERCLYLLAGVQEVLGAADDAGREEAYRGLARVEPRTGGDLVFFHALVRQIRPVGGASFEKLAARMVSPVSLLTDFDLLEVDAGRVQQARPAVCDPILLPVLGEHLVQRWGALETHREGLTSPQTILALNERQRAAWNALWTLLARPEQVQGLVVFARFFARLWRWSGGLQSLLERVRRRAQQPARQQEREAVERSWGELYRFGPFLEEWAVYLRDQSWADLSEGQRFFLGEYARHYEGIAAEVRLLQRELCREI